MQNTNLEKLKIDNPEFFEKLDRDLAEYAGSEEFATAVARACLLNNVDDNDTIEKIAYWSTWTLFGAIPEKSLIDLFEQKIKLDSATAFNIYEDIDDLVFSQIEEEIRPEEDYSKTDKVTNLTSPQGTRDKKLPKKDVYRENLE